MSDVTVERDIAAPPERVWALISDITRMGEWSPEARGGVWIKGATGAAVGAKFKGKNTRGKRSWSTDCEVIACEPGSAFAFRVTTGPLAVADWSYTITPTATGSHVVETWTDTRGTIIKGLGRLVTGVADRASHNRDGMEQTLAGLATAAEAGTV
jgi:uncharacterized protein YndB with AHSA1/START domain